MEVLFPSGDVVSDLDYVALLSKQSTLISQFMPVTDVMCLAKPDWLAHLTTQIAAFL